MLDKSLAKTIINTGVKVYYWVLDGDKGNLVLIPGSANNHTSLLQLGKMLNILGFSVILFDPRGEGYSDVPNNRKEYSVTKYAEDLEMIVLNENLASFSFITYSFGFMVAVTLSNRMSHAKQIITIAGSHNYSKTTLNRVLYYLFQFFFRYYEYVSATINEIKAFITRRKTKYIDLSSSGVISPATVLREFKAGCTFKLVDGFRKMAYENIRKDITNDIKLLTRRIVYIRCKDDHMVTKRAPDEIRKFAKDFKYEEVEGGHLKLIYDPKEIFKVIIKYL